MKELQFLNDMIHLRIKEYVGFNGGELRVLTKRGNFVTKISYDGVTDTVYGFDCKFMIEALTHLKEAKTITVKIFGPNSPIVLTGNESDLALVLPVRERMLTAA